MCWIKFLSEVEGLDNRPEQKVSQNDYLGIKLSWTTLKWHIGTTLNKCTAYLIVVNKESLKKHEICT